MTDPRKILLTSAGFETKIISDAFLNFLGKDPKESKVLFIPAAAVSPDAINVLPKCMNDLLKVNILPENITVFDLHCLMAAEELSAFDTVYFTGGSSQYLLNRINETGFNTPLNDYVSKGGVYVGVSAGSVVAAGNFINNLGYLKAALNVHCETGTAPGIFDDETVMQIDLTNNAVLIHNGKYEIIG